MHQFSGKCTCILTLKRRMVCKLIFYSSFKGCERSLCVEEGMMLLCKWWRQFVWHFALWSFLSFDALSYMYVFSLEKIVSFWFSPLKREIMNEQVFLWTEAVPLSKHFVLHTLKIVFLRVTIIVQTHQYIVWVVKNYF